MDLLEIEVSRVVMAYVMPLFDCSIALLFFYMAASLTRDFGFGTKRELLLFTHRVFMFLGSGSFAYHAFDILRDSSRHGLTFSNFQLHFVIVVVVGIATLRMRIAEDRVYAKNGDGFAGPFPRHS
jgi:hypothetical protein